VLSVIGMAWGTIWLVLWGYALGSITLPARAISTKNKHLLLSPFGDTNPRFHGGSFGVWGHTSSEAL